ncbi:MAG: helix-turn-helix transcriptional regulator [Bacteroidota bacterium]
MSKTAVAHLKSISDLHRFNNLSAPEHPLISLIDYRLVKSASETNELKWIQGYYSISLKRNVAGKYRYGQYSYDFDEGLMTFFAPDQLITVQLLESDAKEQPPSGWILAIHPDFFFGTSLAQNIKKYPFFKYSVREALFLSEKEEKIILDILQNIQGEYQSNIDKFSEQIIVSQLELLLGYSERFYQRQFLTRKIVNHQTLSKLESYLDDYFNSENLIDVGLPSVNKIADHLNLTPDYLSSLLKSLTGQTTQQHIHSRVIETAKVKLSTTELSVSEIAYGLGFEHPQSFSKLFKSKTKQTPLEFRMSFN